MVFNMKQKLKKLAAFCAAGALAATGISYRPATQADIVSAADICVIDSGKKIPEHQRLRRYRYAGMAGLHSFRC